MMTILSYVSVAFKRLASRKDLSLLLILSTALTIAIMVCVPVFSGGVSLRIMKQEFSAKSEAMNRPIFPVRFFSKPSEQQPMTLEQAEYNRDWIINMLMTYIRLPIKTVYMQVDSPFYQLRPRKDDPKYTREYLDAAKVVYVQDIDQHIDVVSGAPFGAYAGPEVLSVWVEKHFADELALQVNEVYDLGDLYSTAVEAIPVRVAGIWEAKDPAEHFWYALPEWHFNGVLLTTYQDYQTHIYPRAPEKSAYVFWYFVLDDTKMNLNRAPFYVNNLNYISREVQKRLPGSGVDTAPTGGLIRGQHRKVALSLILLGFSIPLIGILIYFMASVSSMLARFQGQEVAMLSSRGSSRTQILVLMLLETVLLLLFACPLGIFMGMGLARMLGYSLSFLTFSFRDPLEVHLAQIDWNLFAAAVAASIVARLVPTWFGSRFSVVTHERQTARRQAVLSATRLLFMAILAAVTLYTYRQLSLRGSLGLISLQPEDPTNDPLLLLAPSLFLFTTPLIASELFVLLMRPLTLVSRFMPSVTAYIGSLNHSREGGQYRTPVYMLVLCLSLGVFYASLATSADIWSVDQRRYQVGADITFTYKQEEDSGSAFGSPAGSSSQGEAQVVAVPIGEYEKVPGVAAATEVGEYTATVPMGRTIPKMRMLAIDRLSFPRVAYFRSDFAPASLGDLMNRLGGTPNGVLVPSDLISTLQLGVGDTVKLNFSLDNNQWYPFEFTIVGTFSYFPTMYEQQAPVVIVNLDYLQNQTGGMLPFGIWLRLQPGADTEQVLKDVSRVAGMPSEPKNLQALLTDDQNRLERVGVFGMLSVCFLAGALLSGLGLLIYSFASLARRSLGFAVLQAIGMKRDEIMRVISVEYLLTLIYGLLAGVALGVTAALFYVPFFPITDRPGVPIPPFKPYVDWGKAGWIAVAMGITLIAVEAIILIRMARTRIFEILRLGTRE